MELATYEISFQIYARSPEEAELGKNAFVRFIRLMREKNAAVTGEKLDKAIGKLDGNLFVKNEIVKFFKE